MQKKIFKKENFVFKKSLLFSVIVGASLLFAGCGDKVKNTNVVQKAEFKDIKVGNKLADFTIANQFDKKFSLINDTKIVMFAATKDMGHVIKQYLANKSKDYLEKRKIIFIADISSMPTIIFNMFALSDMQSANYSMLLIKKEQNAKRFVNEAKKDYIMILSLNNKIITDIKYVNNQKDLQKEID